MKILIVGTGGVGGFYGGLLARAGNDVTFLARGEHFRKIQESGLRVQSVVGDFVIKPAKVISKLSQANTPDLVLLCIKTYDTEEISKQLTSIINKDTVIISLQNGIDNAEQISKYIKNAIVVPGCTYIIAERAESGLIVQKAGPRKIFFGSKNKAFENKLLQIEKLCKNAQIDATYSAQIEKELWTKFLFIVPFAGMTSICRTSIGPIVNNPGTYSLYKCCLSEVLQLGQRLNIGIGEEEHNKIMKRCEDYKHKDADAKSSMLIDIENGRRIEIESLNGSVCRLAKEVGMEVPVNEFIYYVVGLSNPTTISNPP